MVAHNSPQTGLMAEYDANEATVMVNGTWIFGFGEDTMFTSEYDNDKISIKQDPQGTGVASHNNKTGATLTINLDETSPSNKALRQLADVGNFPVDIITSTNHIHAVHCYITKTPTIQGAATSSNRAWVIKAIDMQDEAI